MANDDEPPTDTHTVHLPPLPGGELLRIETLPPAASADSVLLGGKLWAAAASLCAFLIERRAALRGRRVLELGAGVGACGLYAGALGAEHVLLTDCEEQLCELMRANIHENRLSSRVSAQRLSWGAREWAGAPYEWVIGSDVVWGGDHEAHAALCRTVRGLLSCGASLAVLASEHGLPTPTADGCFRDATLDEFAAAAAAEGLRVSMVEGWGGRGAADGRQFEWTAEAFAACGGSPSEAYLIELRLDDASEEAPFVPEEEWEGTFTQGDGLMARKVRRNSAGRLQPPPFLSHESGGEAEAATSRADASAALEVETSPPPPAKLDVDTPARRHSSRRRHSSPLTPSPSFCPPAATRPASRPASAQSRRARSPASSSLASSPCSTGSARSSSRASPASTYGGWPSCISPTTAAKTKPLVPGASPGQLVGPHLPVFARESAMARWPQRQPTASRVADPAFMSGEKRAAGRASPSGGRRRASSAPRCRPGGGGAHRSSPSRVRGEDIGCGFAAVRSVRAESRAAAAAALAQAREAA
ncbi:hypothetical protein AB1Y20_018027 [Prymnesium parvum]|uniref:Calmodulin-lysine N-methyltransferase n=1 Tax=Prymnesium parvum TaxID=97485 RepID=A0AB34JQE4_PRYPA